MNPSRRPRRSRARFPWLTAAAAAAIVLGGLGMLLMQSWRQDRLAARMNPEAEAWLQSYWKIPIAPQGTAPAAYVEFAKGIAESDCAVCHPIQAQDWSASLHGRTMGPGVTGQLAAMSHAEQAECMPCHAPLSEQWAGLPGGKGGWQPNPGYDARLAGQGLVCAACHVRAHVRHGPPQPPDRPVISRLFHGEPVRTTLFEAAEFCRGCHQHGPEFQAPNGKPVENTYAEWLESRYPAQGKACQTCHMPGRKHLWQGIHDPETTRAGVTINARADPPAPRRGQTVRAELSLRNTGTGHAFPTYTTPAVYLRAAFVDAGGRELPGTEREQRIQRRLDMTTEPWGEAADTRVLPDREARLAFSAQVPAGAAALRLWVWVEPDQFYTEFYRARLAEQPLPDAAKLLALALKNATASAYPLFERTFPVAEAGQ
jgi:hypothetical protein